MNIHDTLETVFDNYLAEKEKPFKANWLAATLREGIDADGLSFSTDNVKIYGSGGTSLWAAAPWIAICDTEITKSVQRGFFVVYLFSEDMKRVYLSLNQGWTFWEKEFKDETIDMSAEAKAKAVASYFQNELSIRNTALPMKLSANSSKHNLAFGYEAGEIYSIEYDANQLPSNTELVKDLELMWSKFLNLKAMLQDTKDLEKSATYILNYQRITSYTDNAEEAETIADKLEHASLIEKERPIPRKKSKSAKGRKNRTVRKTDYLAEQERKQKLGLSGEELVLEYEKERLANYPDLQNKVKRVSKEGDGDGYDIFSFNFDGSPLYIEVKTTNNEATAPFFMSQNEYAFALENKENYVIYRLYEFTDLAKKNIDQVKFYKIQGQNIEQELNLIPAAYQVNLK